jgi:pimeloyl-ACP methyl ester carboxylesterase
MSPTTRRVLERDGASIAWREAGDGPAVVLLHATLASGRELEPLVTTLAGDGFRVLAPDRRGSGDTRVHGDAPSAPIDASVHVADLVAILEAAGTGPALVAGHSFGGCIALELAAREPGLVAGVWAWEPPYAPVAPGSIRAQLEAIGRRTVDGAAQGGPPAAAGAFFDAVSAPATVAGLPPSARERIEAAGAAAIADASLLGLDAGGLAAIRCPVIVATGGASWPAYAAIAAALAERIPTAAVESHAGAAHMTPISRPDLAAGSIRAFAARIGHAASPGGVPTTARSARP